MNWLEHLTPPQRQLAELMSETSESSYCATWYVDTERRLWRFLIDPKDDGDWGYFPIPSDAREALRELSRRADGWICWNEDGPGEQPSYVPMAEWLARYEAGSDRTY